MKVKTENIKPFLSSKFTTPESQIKRIRKYKDSSGKIVREFSVGTKIVNVVTSSSDGEVLEISETGKETNQPPCSGSKNKFNNYYFAVAENSHKDEFTNDIVVELVVNPKKYWDKEKCICDMPLKIENDLYGLKIESPNETGDCIVYGETDPLAVVQLLLNLGLEYNNDMANWLTSTNGKKFYIKP